MGCSTCRQTGPVPARPSSGRGGVSARQTVDGVTCGTMGVGAFDPSRVFIENCQVTEGDGISPGGRAFVDVLITNTNAVRVLCGLRLSVGDRVTEYQQVDVPPDGQKLATVNPQVPDADGTYSVTVEKINVEAA